MNLTESIRRLMIESSLTWKTLDPNTGAQEAVLQDGSKFVLYNYLGKLTVSYVPKGGTKGNEIYHTPANAPGSFAKAKQAAENFLGTRTKENEELGPDNEWGTDELTNKEKKVTPGQAHESALGDPQSKSGWSLWNRPKAGIGKWNLIRTSGDKNALLALRKDMLGQRSNAGYEYLVTPRALPNGIPDENIHGMVCKSEPMNYSGLESTEAISGQVTEAIGQSGLDIEVLSSKMGLKKPLTRKVGNHTSYLFRGIRVTKLRASVENAGYPEIEAFQFGDEHITDHKKGDVVLRVGPAEQGNSAWLTVKSDYPDYAKNGESDDLYQEVKEIPRILPINKDFDIILDALREDGFKLETVKYAVDYGIKNPRVTILSKGGKRIILRMEIIPYKSSQFNFVCILDNGYGETYVVKQSSRPADAIEAIKEFLSAQDDLNIKEEISGLFAVVDEDDTNKVLFKGHKGKSYSECLAFMKDCNFNNVDLRRVNPDGSLGKMSSWVEESLNDACWSGYKAIGTKEKDGKTVPNCVPESKEEDIEDLRKLMDNPDVAFAKKNYGSVEAYKSMLKRKIDALQQTNESALDKSEAIKDEVIFKLQKMLGSETLNDWGMMEVRGWIDDHLEQGLMNPSKIAKAIVDDYYNTEATSIPLKLSKTWLRPGKKVMMNKKSYTIDSILSNGRVLLKDKDGPMEVASSVLSPKNEAIAGAKIVTLKPSDKLEVKYGSLIVNGRPFEMTDPDESLDWPKFITDDGKLITWFKGRQSNSNEWSPSDISGYFTDQESLKTESASISEKHVQIVSLITEESDREIVKDFLIENDITGHESEISNIRNLFLRFKKYHSSNK